MTDIVTTNEPRRALLAGGKVAALVPQSLEEAFRVANAIAASGLAPRGMDKPEQVLVAVMAGAELGLAPFQALQSFAVVNGRPTLWGDGLMAVARSQGVAVKEWLDGEGDHIVACCEVRRPDTGEVIQRSFSVADARKAGLWGKQGPWQQHPKRMLQMRARGYALRDGCADILRGFQVREEVEDYEPAPLRPAASGVAERLAGKAAAPGFSKEHVDRETGEIIDVVVEDVVAEPEGPRKAQEPDPEPEAPHVPVEDDTPATPQPEADALGSIAPTDDPLEWFEDAKRYVSMAEDVDTLAALDDQWHAEGWWDRLRKASPATKRDLADLMRERHADLTKKERA